jgi:glucose-6-phosphate 1-dehydrogenase
MNATDALDELLTCRLDTTRKTLEPFSLVIFGATGDLTARKLMPALYHLFAGRQLPEPFRIVGVGRREKSDESWRAELKQALETYSRTKPVEAARWQDFAGHVSYCEGDMAEPGLYVQLAALLERAQAEPLRQNRLFYLAIAPSQFTEVVAHLHQARLLSKGHEGPFWHRVVVEKPFGHDLASAHALNVELTRFAHEKQIYRIDHYLGKETVQNILLFRFSNALFEQIWHRQAVDHVQFTACEQIGVGARGGYYEEAGALRDMVQNHMLQVLALMAMEPPVSLDAESIRDEKVKLLKSIRVLLAGQVPLAAIRGQYSAGTVNGQPRGAYREELKVRPDSNIETFVALKVMVDNWRWAGVPFFLRTGKNLPLGASEVRVQFRPTPHVLFAAQCGPRLAPNSVTLRLQPHEGITLHINGKVPGIGMEIRPVRLHFSYDSEFGAYTPEAYERLLLDAMAGDATLFIRRDEVEAAWSIVDPIREYWADRPLDEAEFYPAGTWGPAAADELLTRAGHAWRNPQPLA